MRPQYCHNRDPGSVTSKLDSQQRCTVGRCAAKESVLKSPRMNTDWSADRASTHLKQFDIHSAASLLLGLSEIVKCVIRETMLLEKDT